MAKKIDTLNGPSLFSTEELTRAMGGFDFKEDQPVTVLGKTFANDNERRAYYREELRKKLPELRHIEGFPIGSDDDIINLSDPPYYTACPNPWLNDFIAQWEEEKNELFKQGKRDEEKVVTEPYASDVSEGKNNPIYMAHAYHTKVPHPAIMRYILHYTEPGDIVFDGFCGTGMTGVAAQLCGSTNDVNILGEKDIKVGIRHSICSDLSPIASLIAASYTLPYKEEIFIRKANAVLDQVEKELGWMYEIKVGTLTAKNTSTVWSDVASCPNCGQEMVLWEVNIDEKNKKFLDGFKCPQCGFNCDTNNVERLWETYYDDLIQQQATRNKKVPVKFLYSINRKRGERAYKDIDAEMFDKIERVDISNCHSSQLKEGYNTNQPIKRNGITHTHQFYTRRSFIYLSRVYELVKDDKVLLAWFTSSVMSTTKMNRFRFSGTGLNAGTLYVPSINWEFTPYQTLKRKITSFSSIFYNQRGNSAIAVNSATSLDTIKDSSIDYMFIDPPFGANIMYSEVSSIWEGWIKVSTNDEDEAIVNEYQDKGLPEYQSLMNQSLKEFYRILKPGKWLTMEFSNTSASVWNSIQNALQGVGFIVANVAALDKKQGSFKAVTSTTAVKQDLIITCFKPTEELQEKFNNSQDLTQNVWDFVDEYLRHLPVHLEKGNATTTVIERNPKILFDRLISYYVQRGYPVPLDATAFQQGLRERYIEKDGMFFTAVQAAEYEEKKKLAPEFVPMGIIVSDESNGIQWLKNLLRNAPKTYQEIQPEWMQALSDWRKGDIQPELKTLLEENFIEMPDGKWRLPNIQDDVDKEALRTKSLLKEFKLYVDQAQKPKAKIKEARVEALRTGFKDCYIRKDFQTIVTVGDKIPQNLRDEDEVLLQFYDIALNKL